MNLTYSKPLTSLVRALGLQSVARETYYALRRPRNELFSPQIMGRTCNFWARDAIELRTVELAFQSELPILHLILSEIRSGDSFLDVGANLGLFSIFAAAFGAKVVACEPEPIALQRLMANRKANSLDFQVVAMALSNARKEVSFSATAANQIVQNSQISNNGTLFVKCIPGDDLKLNPDIVKIDVEGHEIQVLHGLLGSLDRCRLCAVEVHDESYWNGVEQLLRSCGFTGFQRLHGKLIGSARR